MYTTVIVSMDCQIGRIQNHLREGTLGMAVGGYLDELT